jgi:hypothetical protein
MREHGSVWKRHRRRVALLYGKTAQTNSDDDPERILHDPAHEIATWGSQ